MTEQVTESRYDPFDGAEGTNTAILITLMRIYDVLMTQLSEADDDRADTLSLIHAQGRLVGSLPQFSGE